MPKFQKSLPKNASSYFHPDSDEKFRQKHPINKIFTVTYPIVLLLLLGRVRVLAPVICFLFVLTCLIAAVMFFFVRIQSSLDDHGVPFVLFQKSTNDGIDSVFFDLFLAALPLFVAYAHILLTLDLFS